jgi:predicted acylesterase/phospholipase RssA
VADAVAISMSLPLIFKPARVDAEVPVTEFNRDPQAYQGFWVDGGVLNNLSVHAFDANFMDPARAASVAEPLNPRVVALRFTEGAPGLPPPQEDPDTIGIGAFLGAFAETLLHPSERGQLRSPAEAEQTIDFYTYELETTEFAPPPEKSRQPIAAAEESVVRYFNPGMF